MFYFLNQISYKTLICKGSTALFSYVSKKSSQGENENVLFLDSSTSTKLDDQDMKEAFIEGNESLPLPEGTVDEEDKSILEIVLEESYLDCEDESTYFECEDEETYFECEDEDAAFIERIGKSDNKPTSSPECELKENEDDDHNWKLVTKKRKRRVKRREMKNENLNKEDNNKFAKEIPQEKSKHPDSIIDVSSSGKRSNLPIGDEIQVQKKTEAAEDAVIDVSSSGKRSNLPIGDEIQVQKKTETVEDAVIDVSSSSKKSNLPIGHERKIQKTTTEAVKDENCNAVDFEIIFYQLTGIIKKEEAKKDQYFGSTSDLNDRYFANDYQKGDIIQHLNAMLEKNLDVTNSDLITRRTNQESTVADILDFGTRSNNYGSISNVFGLSNLNVPNGSFKNTTYEAGSNMSYNPSQNNSLKSLTFSKPYGSSPLSKLLSQNWSNNGSNMRAIRAASPPLFNSDNCPSTFEQALMMGCEGFRENRRSSSTESGISSVSELGSISDLKNNLNIGTTVGQGSGVASTTPSINSGLTDDLPVVASPFFSDRRLSVSSVLNSNYGTDSDLDSIERDARLYRRAAAFSEANCTWSGPLPSRSNENPSYSCKVFLGGVPRDITEAELIKAFAPFGPIKIVWPGKDNRGASCSSKGYNYIIFESEKQVEALLQACTHDCSNGGNLYFKISSRTRSKQVRVIPWDLRDSNFIKCSSQSPCKTIFVGALHGMLNAEGLALIMHDLFGGVLYASIDSDKYKYPIGSGRVTFNNDESYMMAVSAAVIEIKTPRFTKRVQLDPYIEDTICSGCQIQQGPIFCRDLACFRYFCHSCWKRQHLVDTFRSHKPMMRNKTNRQVN